MYKGKLPYFEISVKVPNIDLIEKIFFDPILGLFLFFGPKKLISRQEDMKIKKNTFSILDLELFCQSKFSCSVSSV
jgi:hypothetical protein